MNQNAAIWFISIQSVVNSWRLINNINVNVILQYNIN